MMVFWIVSIALLVLSGLVLLLPLFKRQEKGISQTKLNQSLYKNRLDELSKEDDQGLADDSQQLVSELQYNLLDDVVDEPESAHRNVNVWQLVPGLAFLVVASVGLYFYLGAKEQVTHWQAVQQRLPELSERILGGQSEVSDQELQDFALALRSKLQAEGDDPRGWFILAKVGQALNRLDIMTDASEKAHRLQPNDPSIIAVYAQSLLFSGDPNDRARAERMLVLALRENTQSLELWSMYAFLALEQQDYASAIGRWEQMLGLLEPGSPRAEVLQQSIEFAQAQLGASGQGASEQAQVAAAPVASAGPSYTITVDVDQGLSVPSSSFLFVYAKAVNGPPMPIAARKVAAPVFPVTVTLSDSDSMMEGLKLSQQGDFFITARLSYDDNVQTTSGDWEGTSDPVAQGEATPIRLTIDQLLP
ncbi:c-type cytochrome biogenesis protein CcmI [Aliagarivorans marinus]|uniref:c-type cytochrome biogenesis protein CcmI n=1 Tax=Aliagarivorans marinus TaxID=561965 RepID=UPI000405C502|nr:c-type cytochrome biogenesis protein CcmI [Aliagarivorans marinus]